MHISVGTSIQSIVFLSAIFCPYDTSHAHDHYASELGTMLERIEFCNHFLDSRIDIIHYILQFSDDNNKKNFRTIYKELNDVNYVLSTRNT